MLPASLAAWVPAFMATPTSAEPARVHRRTVSRHRNKFALGLLVTDQSQLVLGRGLRQKIIDACLSRDGRGG